MFVSILARAEARALRLGEGTRSGLYRVSILARAEARALLRNTEHDGQLTAVSILARAEARALHLHGLAILPANLCFNPRPRRGAGATPQSGDLLSGNLGVSILARAEARALP